MSSLRDFMARDHLHCDGVFLDVEQPLLARDWDSALAASARVQTLQQRLPEGAT